MFRSLLIANRGEVAARVARTCKRLGVRSVAVASAADLDQAWLADVDQVVPLGPAPSSQSYLDQEALIEVGLATGCTAVHPGWGFLSENDQFAARVQAAGLTFVGPSPRHIRDFGDKAKARETMGALGMPLIPGSDGPLTSLAQARRVADEVGYPVLLKAVSGGGGRGMRFVDTPEQLEEAWQSASIEAAKAFGDDRLYLEKRITGGRHVEIQVLADHWGNAWSLGERECSLQRRHQKVLEEAPSPGLSAAERERILPLVADVVRKSGYANAGTVEMLLSDEGQLYFMEMNTRLQVEHPVTELLTGLDLVEQQLLVASNHRLSLSPTSTGHAIECRINAEDPAQGFRPSPGRLTTLRWPTGEGVRVDTHVSEGDVVPPNYDSMLGKVICYGKDRTEAIERMGRALADTAVEGVANNIALHQRILTWPRFLAGEYDTTTLETELGRA